MTGNNIILSNKNLKQSSTFNEIDGKDLNEIKTLLSEKNMEIIYDEAFNCVYDTYYSQLENVSTINRIDRNAVMRRIAEQCNFSDDKFKECMNEAADRLDLLIPRLYFLKYNQSLVQDYGQLFIDKIYLLKGKNAFDYTKDIKYFRKHNFDFETRYALKHQMTDKQFKLLKTVSTENGYGIKNAHLLFKEEAIALINYFMRKTFDEPVFFDFYCYNV